MLPPGDVLKVRGSRSRATSARRGVCCWRACRRSSTIGSAGTRRQSAAVDDAAIQRGLFGGSRRAACAARVRRAGLAGEHRAGQPLRRISDGSRTIGEIRGGSRRGPDLRGATSSAWWLEPECAFFRRRRAIARFEAAIIGPGSFYTSLMRFSCCGRDGSDPPVCLDRSSW